MMIKDREISVLLTGGDGDACEAVRGIMEDSAPHITVATAESPAECLTRTGEDGPDCVVACCRESSEDLAGLVKSLKRSGVPVVLVARGNNEGPRNGAYDLISLEAALETPALLVKTVEHAAGHSLSEQGRRQAEKALLEQMNNLDVILDSIGESIIIQDTGFKVIYQNKANRDLTGDHIGEDCFRAFEDRPEICEGCPVVESFRDGEIYRVERSTPTETGEMHVEMTSSCLRDSDGNIKAGVKVVRDVTARKNLERRKADLIAMVTHDLKLPLSVIQGYTELIISNQKNGADSETLDMAAAIKRSCGRLLGMVEDFLAISRMESGAFAVNSQPVNIGKLVRDVVEDNRALAGAKGVELELDLEDVLPIIPADPGLVMRAVSNLIVNAVGFTPKGGKVVIGVGSDTSADGEDVVVSVSDTGPGIPAPDRTRLFDTYYHSSSAGQPAGSGLGLAVVKAVAEAHGGLVELESELDRGSTFRIILPATR